MKHRVFVVIPCYNEGAVIHQTLSEVLAQDVEVILVDDGSTDNSYQKVKGLSIHYLRHSIRLGQGAALQTGMDYAASLDSEIVVHFDADGQHDATEIRQIIEPVINGEADIVLGSRFLLKESAKKIPFLRKIILKLGTFVNGLFTGVWLTDSHNGFRAMNSKSLNKIRLTENGMSHATEILSEIRRNKLKYVEFPTHVSYTSYSMAKGQRISNSINILVSLMINKIIK